MFTRRSLNTAVLLAAMSIALAIAAQTTTARPSFEVATIKPSDPQRDRILGFISQPGGRVYLGNATLKTILYYAFNLPILQITGGPAWVDSDHFTIEAVPPDSAVSRTAKQPPIAATPSDEQRKMLQALLADRFALRYHMDTKDSPVYILSRGTNRLQLQEPKDKDRDARGGVMMKSGGIADGEAFGHNLSMRALAESLSSSLSLPVLDQTGLAGAYDFHLDPDDPENHDYTVAVFDAMHRLGLNLKKGRGPVETLVIDHVERPTEN